MNNSEVLMVGDTAVDLLFAKNAQIDACWAAYGYGVRDECVSLEPTFVINNIEELFSIII
ncbi:HAD family hydrolase [Microcoleus sp.]|uniref:HAD family hydrolase n=1 Tax=Microcoleus sp. TaxID=44472 RepID=UPI0035259D11